MDFSFKSYNVCAVQPSYDYYTLLLCQTAARQFEAFFSMSDGRTGRLNKLIERNSAWWDNFVSKTVIEEDWR